MSRKTCATGAYDTGLSDNIQTSELTEKAGFSPNILTRLRRDQYVSLDSIEKICFALDCKVDDILEFIPVDKENENG